MTIGTCSFCQRTVSKSGMTSHLNACKARKRSMQAEKGSGRVFHLVVEGFDAPEYWMHIEAPGIATLSEIDDLLREVWVECCGHLSAFFIDGVEYSWLDADDLLFGMVDYDESIQPMSKQLFRLLRPGLTFQYHYDFGSTTRLKLRVVSQRRARVTMKPVEILARNVVPEIPCVECGERALEVCTECAWEGRGWLCLRCIQDHECERNFLLPVVNSPRVGVCGYTGATAPESGVAETFLTPFLELLSGDREQERSDSSVNGMLLGQVPVNGTGNVGGEHADLRSGEQVEPDTVTQQWDPRHYNESFSFIWQYGAGVLELLEPRAGERILDLGCGTGHLTAKIAEKGAEVVGFDHSAEMIEAARGTYPELEFHQMDATDFAFHEPFDAVFSNATLHWVRPPDQAVECIFSALKPGGRFVAEFGGQGNVGRVVRALVAELESRGYRDAAERNPWYFPSIAEYTALIEEHGLEPTFARLYDRPTLLDGGEDGLTGWLTMFADSFFEGIADAEREEICAGVADRLRPSLLHDGNWYADYRRLQVVAVKG